MRLERKRQKVFVYEGFGFPVELRNVRMVLVRGAWTPDVDFNRLSAMLLAALAHKPARLTGDEVRFIRMSLSMSLVEFASRFAVSHPAVMKWERSGSQATAMAWATEKDVRLELLRRVRVKPTAFVDAYGELTQSKPARPNVPTVLRLGSSRSPGVRRRRSSARAA
jgi:DNA-binding transcriptional regulator YiaG